MAQALNQILPPPEGKKRIVLAVGTAPTRLLSDALAARAGDPDIALQTLVAINRLLARMMDGEVGVNSTAGAGSLFWFTVRLLKVSK